MQIYWLRVISIICMVAMASTVWAAEAGERETLRIDNSSSGVDNVQEKKELYKGEWIGQEDLKKKSRSIDDIIAREDLYTQSMMLAEDTLAFEWHALVMHVLYLVRDNIDLNRLVAPYMQVFFPKIWQKYHQDEFEYENQKNIYKQKLKTFLDDFNPDVKYGVFSGYKFGRYDFDKKQFVFSPFQRNSFIATTEKESYGLPSIIKVFFVNHDKIDGIKMDEERAKSFIAARRNDQGMINRAVWGYLTFDIQSIYKNKIGNTTRVMAKIRSLTLYNDNRKEEIITIYTFD